LFNVTVQMVTVRLLFVTLHFTNVGK